ncbi:MAG TPA: 3-hydroxyacyl-CoA dehydrogenase NAD-binding domain-containing protein [Burkholderiales bacterium]|jgi:3-hydroxyacyl-CoA dehydrogenase|nr:3-hydroxyacyl-CoA dehydrogenase NAD-binding domain-containing protein [Burkholderiales bacterium]
MTPAVNEVASYSVRDGIAVVTLNNPPVNGLSNALRAALMAHLKKAEADPAVKAVVLIGSAKAFCGGADIREFNHPREKPDLPEVNDQQDAMQKPIVAAIGGFALGGGLELALACHYRVSLPKAQIGLPEVKLGILPGSGGTQRLPRVIPMAEAVRMMTTGTLVPAERAKELGAIDEIVQGDLLESALAYTRRLLQDKKPLRRIRDLKPQLQGDAKTFFAQVREQVAKESKGYPAPLEIVACAEAAATRPFDEGRKFERERFAHLVNTPESKALRHMFFAERQTSKIPDVPESTPQRELRKAAIVGAGTMGGGIAMSFANAGIPVTLIDATPEAVQKGLAKIKSNYAATVSKGRLKQEDMDKRLALIQPAADLAAAGDADIVIEAVFERMDVKQDVFRKLDAIAKPGAILATNTSTLDVNKIAEATKRPQDVIGTHFFSPANVMRLLEVVRAKHTAKDVLASTMKLGKTLKKVPVVAGVCDGFIGNRMLEKYGQQALFLIDEGASPQQVDGALQKWGMAMGPFAMYDMAGQDIGWEIRKRRYVERPDFVYSRVADRVCELGRFGQKTGKGFYRYEPGNRKPIPDPAVDEIISSYRKEIGIKTRAIPDDEIVERCIYALVNEGARILEEGIALRASDIDMVYLTGYGFPPYRGGPMFYADSVGLDKVLAAIEGFQKGYQGAQWKPAPLLVKLAKEGRTFNA